MSQVRFLPQQPMSNDDNLQDLLIASRAAVDRMRDVLNALDRNGWPLFAHSLYLPMAQLERAYSRFSEATSPQSRGPAHHTPGAPLPPPSDDLPPA
jgi:hypothetical protein